MKILIIGYGSAGRRWHKYLNQINRRTGTQDEITTFDPDPFAAADLQYIGSVNEDIVIIATPPDTHLGYAKQALDIGCTVLCEKPLCDFGQLEQAAELKDHPNIDKFAIAYNYLYHPNILALSKKTFSAADAVSISRRDGLPAWGLQLDNFSHTIAILTALDPSIQPVEFWDFYSDKPYYVGRLAVKGREIDATATEVVYMGNRFRKERVAGLSVNERYFDTTGSMDIMMGGVWTETINAFTGKAPRWLNYNFALVVQEKLERMKELYETA